MSEITPLTDAALAELTRQCGLTQADFAAVDKRLIYDVLARLETAEREREELRADKARLDAIESGKLSVQYRSMLGGWEAVTDAAHPAHRKHYMRRNLREMLDVVMKAAAQMRRESEFRHES